MAEGAGVAAALRVEVRPPALLCVSAVLSVVYLTADASAVAGLAGRYAGRAVSGLAVSVHPLRTKLPTLRLCLLAGRL